MRNLKPAVWIVIGMIIGAAGVSTATSSTPQQKPGPRLQTTSAGTLYNSQAFFVKDSKTGACWLALAHSSEPSTPMALTPAPKEACD